MVSFVKRNKNVFIIILSALIAVALGVLCAILLSKEAKMVWSDFSNYSYLSNESVVYETSQITSSAEQTESEDQYESNVQSQTSSASAPAESTPTPAPDPIIINEYSPYEKQYLNAGTTFTAVASARPDSTAVTASFNGQTINLEMQPYDLNADGTTPEFVIFSGEFTLPTNNKSDLNLGAVTFYVKWQNYSKTCTSYPIVCLRDTSLDRTTVVEVIAESAETFDGSTDDDTSDPRLSYLPKGTVDYMIGDVIYDSDSKNSYYKLRCGKRIYVDKKNSPDTSRFKVSTTYAGELPDTNEVSVESNIVSGNHTYLTVNTTWKAPFTFSILPQSYGTLSLRKLAVQSVTYNYIDIKFCYTSAIGGDITIPADNPLFSSSEIIAEDGGYILRLHLKKVGGFYGWNSYYNENGQLVFKFLNPKTATDADNEYRTDLTGITIMLDAGHGGRDLGALGLSPDTMPEAERNLNLTYKIKAELEKMGATVVMTRSDTSGVTTESRCNALRNASPNLCISIHHDSSTKQSLNGCGVYSFNAISHNATTTVFNHIANSGIYSETNHFWHYFYLARVSTCPVVLIENGHISNPSDFEGISNDAVNTQKAKITAQAVADYFKSLQ